MLKRAILIMTVVPTLALADFKSDRCRVESIKAPSSGFYIVKFKNCEASDRLEVYSDKNYFRGELNSRDIQRTSDQQTMANLLTSAMVNEMAVNVKYGEELDRKYLLEVELQAKRRSE